MKRQAVAVSALLLLPVAAAAWAVSGTIALNTDCAPGQVLTCDANGRFISAAPSGGAGGPDCISVPLLDFCAGQTACTFLGGSGSCVSWTDMPAGPANYGGAVEVDMDTYTHAQLMFAGREAAGQTGTVTVKLSRLTNGVADPNTGVSATFNSGETCISRDSTVVDLTSYTGKHMFALELTQSAGGSDDPALSSIVARFCNGAF